MLTSKLRASICLALVLLFIFESPFRLISPRSAAAASLTQAAPQSTSAGVLNLFVRQAVAAAGYQVLSLESTVDRATLQSTARRELGSGEWQVTLLDNQRQSLILDGVLQFELSGQGREESLTSLAVKMQGTLKGGGLELALDVEQSGKVSSEALGSMGNLRIQTRRDGQTSKIALSFTSETKTLGYKLLSTVTTVALERDGQQLQWTQNIKMRLLADRQSEAWVQAVLRHAQDTVLSVDAHLLQHISTGKTEQFYDKFDVQAFDQKFGLQAPAQLSADATGSFKSDVVLLDAQQKPINSPNGPGSGGLRSVLRGPCAQLASDYAGFLVGFALNLGLAMLIAGTFALPLGVFFWAGLAAILSAIINHIMSDPNIPPEKRQQAVLFNVLLQIILGFLGGALGGGGPIPVGGFEQGAQGVIGGIFGGLGWALGFHGDVIAPYLEKAFDAAGEKCNGDPFFIYPDIRSSTSSKKSVQILSVVGGLLRADVIEQALPTPQAGNITADYDERPAAFVGGVVPSDAASIGEWKWAIDRPFGAAPSHTQPAASGPQKHYFTHASNPLQVGPDDNIVQYVYLDSKNAPAEIYLQFYTGNGDGEHRAYCGVDRVQTGGKPGTASLYPMGALPSTGGWVRLKVPADKVGLSGKPINGILYGAYDGQTWWGRRRPAAA